jgi:hypothetical protein
VLLKIKPMYSISTIEGNFGLSISAGCDIQIDDLLEPRVGPQRPLNRFGNTVIQLYLCFRRLRLFATQFLSELYSVFYLNGYLVGCRLTFYKKCYLVLVNISSLRSPCGTYRWCE